MSIRFRPDRNKWEANVSLSGRRKRPLFDSKKEAIEFVRNCRLGKISLQETQPASLALDAAFRIYFECESPKKSSRSIVNDKVYINLAFHFLSAVRHKTTADAVELEDLEAFRRWLKEPQPASSKKAWADGTVARCCATIKRVFRYLVMTKRTANDPTLYWRLPLPEPKRRRPMTLAEFEVILNHSPEWYRPVLKFMRYTGARASSIINMKWQDVDFRNRTLLLKSKKGAQARLKVIRLPMIDEVFNVLIALRNKYPSAELNEPVFRNESGGPLQTNWVSAFGNRIIKKCGLKGVVLYGLRHALATDLTEAGVPLEITRQALCHASVQTTQIYSQGIALESIAKAVRLVRQEKNESDLPPNATKVLEEYALGGATSRRQK